MSALTCGPAVGFDEYRSSIDASSVPRRIDVHGDRQICVSSHWRSSSDDAGGGDENCSSAFLSRDSWHHNQYRRIVGENLPQACFQLPVLQLFSPDSCTGWLRAALKPAATTQRMACFISQTLAVFCQLTRF
nr:hypothetical protein CFP56_73198 [Quercus suber]